MALPNPRPGLPPVRTFAVTLALTTIAMTQPSAQSATATGITAVPGVRVGQSTVGDGKSGCTVVLVEGEGAVGAVAQRGGAPGTRETDLLDPTNMVDRVNAVVLAGGSAFGLDAAQGVVKFLEEHGVGFKTPAGVVPRLKQFTVVGIFEIGMYEYDSRFVYMPLEAALGEAGHDAVVAIGGTGDGRNDSSVRTLARIGRVAYHGVAIAPGETTALGFVGIRPVLLLPGRIDAALAGWLTVGRRMLARLAFRLIEEQPFSAELARDISSQLGLAEVVPVRRRLGRVEPLASGYLSIQALARAEGFDHRAAG